MEALAGQRPLRTVADKMGMGSHIKQYDNIPNPIHEIVLGAFGMDNMLKLKV